MVVLALLELLFQLPIVMLLLLSILQESQLRLGLKQLQDLHDFGVVLVDYLL